MQAEAGVASLKSDRLDYTKTRKLFLNRSSSCFASAPPAAQVLASIIREILLQENCADDTSVLAQVRFFFDVFLVDPLNRLLVSHQRGLSTEQLGDDERMEEVHDIAFTASHYTHGQLRS